MVGFRNQGTTPQPSPVPPQLTPDPKPSSIAGGDVFAQARPDGGTMPLKGAVPNARFDFIESDHGKQTIGWRWTIYTLDDGFNMQRGKLEEGHGRVAKSTLEHRDRGRLTLPIKTTAATSPDPTNESPSFMTFQDNIFGQLAIAVKSAGGGSSVNLFSENATTGVISSHTLEAPITMLRKVVFNDTVYLAVGRAGANAIRLYSDLAASPTLAATMHADTNGAVGLIQMDLPGSPVLIKAGNNLEYFTSTLSPLTTEGTNRFANLPAGGADLGKMGLGGRPIRAFWFWPRPGNARAYGNQVDMDIVSTNAYGTDIQEFPFPELKTVRGGGIIRDGIIAHDDEKLVFRNGGPPHPLRWVTDRERVATRDLLLVGIWIDHDQLYAQVEEVEFNSSGFVTKMHKERYDWEIDRWQPASGEVTLTGTGQKSLNGFNLPVSGRNTHMLHTYADGSWYRQYQPPPSREVYSLRGQRDYEASGELYTPGLIFPDPIGFVPKIMTGAYFGGDPTGGGTTLPTPGAVEFEFLEYGRTAGTGQRFAWDSTVANAGRFQAFPQNQTRVLIPQCRIKLTQGADTTLTPQGLPLIIEGLAFLPEKKRPRWFSW